MEPPKVKHTPIIIFSGYSVYVLWQVGLSIGGLELSRILKEISMLYETISAYTNHTVYTRNTRFLVTEHSRQRQNCYHPANFSPSSSLSSSSSLFSIQLTLLLPANSLPSSQFYIPS